MLQEVSDLARVVGDAALARFKSGLTVETKSDGSPVTDADRGAEMVAREWIERHFPKDGIIGEEHGVVRPGARQELVDPHSPSGVGGPALRSSSSILVSRRRIWPSR